MYQVDAYLKSASWYQQRRQIFLPREARETADAHELRTWKESAHYTAEGYVMIPPVTLKKCIEDAANYLKIPVPGKGGKVLFRQYFLSAVLCLEAPVTDLTRDDLPGTPVAVPSDGRRGGSSRVVRYFPTIEKWEGMTRWAIMDDIVTLDIFEQHLRVAGTLIGLGVWRVAKGGMYGRFSVESIQVVPG